MQRFEITTNTHLKVDPRYADALPPLSESELDDLRESIKQDGIRTPILADWDGTVIDGHHRLMIAEELGLEIEAVTLETDDERGRFNEADKFRLAVNLNVKRRQLSKEQRQALVVELAQGGATNAEIAETVGVSVRTVAAQKALAGVTNPTRSKAQKEAKCKTALSEAVAEEPALPFPELPVVPVAAPAEPEVVHQEIEAAHADEPDPMLPLAGLTECPFEETNPPVDATPPAPAQPVVDAAPRRNSPFRMIVVASLVNLAEGNPMPPADFAATLNSHERTLYQDRVAKALKYLAQLRVLLEHAE